MNHILTIYLRISFLFKYSQDLAPSQPFQEAMPYSGRIRSSPPPPNAVLIGLYCYSVQLC